VRRAFSILSALLFALWATGCASTPRPAPHVRPPVRPLPPPKPPVSHVPSTPLETPAKPAPPPGPSEAQAWAIQIRLDRDNFPPGVLDGRWGRKSRLALAAWEESRGLPATGDWQQAPAALTSPDGLFLARTVTEEDHAALSPTPARWTDKARAPALGYNTVCEKIAEETHLDEAALRRLNPAAAWPDPPAGTVLRVPAVRRARLDSPARIVVRTADRVLRLLDGSGKPLAQFPCSVAARAEKRNVGETLAVAACAREPQYTYDPALFEDAESQTLAKKLLLPGGPNSPVGIAWIGLSRSGFGIHGTPEPSLIGRTESHGCIRLANWDASALLKVVRTGTPVEIAP